MSHPVWDGPALWEPTLDVVEKSNLGRLFQRFGVATSTELHQASIQDVEAYWTAVVDDLELDWFKRFDSVLDLSDGIQWPRWFNGASCNAAHNCVDRFVRLNHDAPALIHETEAGDCVVWTYQALGQEAARLSEGLRSLGVGRGDRVGLCSPMTAPAAAALLAIGRIGAIGVPLFSGFGPSAIATRLRDAGAVALITAHRISRRGTLLNLLETAREAVRQVASVRHMFVLDAGSSAALQEGETAVSDLPDVSLLDSPVEQMDPEDPLLILYTSGTTGRPKGTVHVHGGFPIVAARDVRYIFDVKQDETLFWVTDIGWMMGPWALFGGLGNGATVLLYDGAIDHPAPDRLWSLIDDHDVAVAGVSPTLVRSLARWGPDAVLSRRFSALRIIGSTGEPWDVQSWLWCFENVGRRRLPIINGTGGTEGSGAFLAPPLDRPIKPCSVGAPVGGLDVDVIDANGNSVRQQPGELVIRNAWPGMTRGFWRDPERYLSTYWAKVRGVWVHGDLAYVDSDGHWFLLGRSDDVLNIAGKRTGPSEIESALIRLEEVAEAAVVGVPDPIKGEVPVAFVIADGDPEEISVRAKAEVEQRLGKAFKLGAVHLVPELPKTRSGKIVRRAVRAAFLGTEVGDISSIENVTALDAISELEKRN